MTLAPRRRSPRLGAKPTGQPTSPIQSTVDDVSAAMETDSAEDTNKCLDQLDEEHQKEREIYESQNNEDGICNPLTRASTN
jgi:hypothetical protein